MACLYISKATVPCQAQCFLRFAIYETGIIADTMKCEKFKNENLGNVKSFMKKEDKTVKPQRHRGTEKDDGI